MGDPYPVHRVAAIQAAPVFLDRDASVAKALGLIAEAGQLGARLAVFPETWLPGYPVWFDRAPGAVLWDDPAGKAVHARLVANAVEVPGPATEALCRAAAAAGCAVVMGINERDPESRTLYNTIVTIDADGRLLGAHRKLVPTYAERLVWGRGGGGDLLAHLTAAGRVGGLVCWEHWMPLARHAMHLTGEEIHAALWPDVDDLHHLASRHYAFEGRCFVVAVGAVLRKRDLPADLDLLAGIPGGPDEPLLRGGSAVIGPDAAYLAGPAGDEETILVADLPFERIAAESLTFDAVGHYSRPDVFAVAVTPVPSG